MGLDTLIGEDFVKFAEKVARARADALREDEAFTDKSLIEMPFLKPYGQLVGAFDRPSVAEYGGAVPVLSLYLLREKYLDKVMVVDNDEQVLRQLEAVSQGLKLPVERVNADISSMQSFPDTDVGVSVNALYGYSPTPAQAMDPPKLTRPVISEASHDGFAVFRAMNNGLPWEERQMAMEEMDEVYAIVEAGSLEHHAPRTGYKRMRGQVRSGAGPGMSVLHYVTGQIRK